jgi:L-seryl-tRNA(Ser) seleniumtransferase
MSILQTDQQKKDNLFSRRSFLRWSQTAMAALGALPILGGAAEALGETSTKAAASAADDYYTKLNVRRVINGKGTFTGLTGAVTPPSVQRAIARASLHPVHLEQLQTNAGAYIAKRLRCEAALVSNGASSGITLATAASVQFANNCKPSDIPQNIGSPQFPKNEVIVQRSHRYEYDHAMFLCGVKIVTVLTLDDYKNAFTPNTVMTNFFNSSTSGQISREDWIAVAHQHNVPCHLDAAADMPPIENLWKYTGMGFDFVSFSGGKGIHGPQNAGLLLSTKKNLIDLAAANNNPGQGVGRGMKVAKEQIVGMVAAVDWLLDTQTSDGIEAEVTRRSNIIAHMVKDIPTLTTDFFEEPIANHVPILRLTWDPDKVGITPTDVFQKLRTQDPSIELAGARGNTLSINTWMLLDNEEVAIVGREIRKALKSAKAKA